MELGEIIFSVIFFLASFIYIYCGINIIKINKTGSTNKAFLAVCVAMSIWSFSFAMANISADINSALAWRRISAIGWGSVYSLMLHFLILISKKDLKKKQRKLLGLLHIPALINIYVFSLSSKLSMIQYNLVKIDFGWINISENNGFDLFFRAYYLSYALMSILIAARWQRKLEDKKIANRVRLITYSIIASGLLGSITDVLLANFLSKPVPQLSPIFILLPVAAMYSAEKNLDILGAKTSRKKEIILTGEEEENIFRSLAIGFYIASILTFLSEYIPYMDGENAFRDALTKALIIFSIGFIIRLIQNIKEVNIKRYLTIIVLSLSIPICLFQFIEYGSITVWAFTMILLMTSAIFSKRIFLFSITIVSIISQILIWIFAPEVQVGVESYDYILRIGMIIVAFFISLSVNKVYVSKIKENRDKIKFQKIVSDILFDFLEISQDNFNSKVDDLLAKLGKFFNVDRTYLFIIDHKNKTMTYSNEWCNEGINEEVGTIEDIGLDVFPWWIEELETRGIVYIEDVDKMPEEASEEQAQLYRQKVKSLISVPIIANHKLEAFIGIDSVIRKKVWSSESIEMLNIVANILSSGIMQIKSDREIESMAYYDGLTGLPNRFLFGDRVESAIDLAQENKSFLSIMFIDLDNFKSVNDTLGHDAGDELLKKVSSRLCKTIGEKDTVARFGGDEFIILLNKFKKAEDIQKNVEEIMDVFSKPFFVREQEIYITASGGVATFPIDGESSRKLVKNADMAMYEAKAKGKNQYSLCTDQMKDEIQKNMKLSNDLHRALERDELSVHYQPQISLEDGQIIGTEALLRWKHPEYGMISPGVFIGLAEKNGLIKDIGKWVLKTACSQTKKWQEMGFEDLEIAVNLSGVQFIDENLTRDIRDILEESKLDPKYLELEITESIAIKEINLVISVLEKLKELEVSIAIDDFGTEYSSLSRIKSLPIDKLKIDREFVGGIGKDEKNEAVTIVIINLAKNLGMDVIAEGVETAKQAEFLKKKECDYVQGYYFYRPLPAEEIDRILFSKHS